MNKEEIMKIIKNQDSIVSTGLKKIETIERRKNGEPLDMAGQIELIDVVSPQGCARIEWRKLPVTDDQMLIHQTSDVAAVCVYCGATIHRENLARCVKCSSALCNKHRHRIADGEYVCGKHYIGRLLRKVIGI